MRILLHILVVLACLISWNRALLPIVEYAYNPIKMMELCENKDKPMMNCNGKCQRAQKIQMALGESSKSQYDVPQVIVESFCDFIELGLLHLSSVKVLLFFAFLLFYQRSRPFLLFRPPIVNSVELI
jgi:hypothetical protein